MQTNLSVQTIETSIWIIGSTSKGGMGDWVILQFEPALGLGNHTFANPVSHPSAPLPLAVEPMAHIEVSVVCTKRLVCT